MERSEEVGPWRAVVCSCQVILTRSVLMKKNLMYDFGIASDNLK